jgi:hypothetical protein
MSNTEISALESQNLKEKITKLRNDLSKVHDILEEERNQKKLPKNFDFIQVQRSEIRNISDLAKRSTHALDMLMLFAQTMDTANAVMISYKAMQDLLSISRSTATRAINVLVDDKWIQVVKVGASNAYILNSSVFWTDRGDKKYGTFQAKIVTTFDEQDKDLRANSKVKLKRTPQIIVHPEKISIIEDVKLKS